MKLPSAMLEESVTQMAHCNRLRSACNFAGCVHFLDIVTFERGRDAVKPKDDDVARSQTRDAIVAEIAAAQAKLKALDKSQAERIGTLALKAGLNSIEISDAELTREFEAIVARFREPARTPQPPKAKPVQQSQPPQEPAVERAA